MATFDKATPVANSDLLVISATDVFGRRYLLPGLMAREGDGGHAVHGVAVGLLAAALHSLVDFPLQIAGCAVVFVVLSALMVSWRSQSMEPSR